MVEIFHSAVRTVNKVLEVQILEPPSLSLLYLGNLTCRIIVQQILLIFGKNNTYTTLLGPTRLLILR